MYFTFCFSRNWTAYSDSFRRRPVPRGPGGRARLLGSAAHLALKQRSPFSRSLIPKRRQSLHTGPLYLAITYQFLLDASQNLDSPSLRWTTAVVRDGSNVGDAAHVQSCGLKRTNGGLTSRAGAFHEHLYEAQSVFHRLFGGVVGGDDRGRGGSL